MSSRRLRSLSVAAVFGLVGLQTAVAPFGPAAGAQTAPAPPQGPAKLLDGLSTLVTPPVTAADRSRRGIFAEEATSVAIDATASGSAAVLLADLEKLGLAKRSALEFGFATRVPKAYPMYDMDYGERIEAIKGWLDGIDNLQQVGRNGLHRYNNSDHSMLTAMRAVDNLVKGTEHDIWAVNAESAYHEEGEQEEQHPYIEAPDTDAMKEPLHR